jgi:hypothetical protein
MGILMRKGIYNEEEKECERTGGWKRLNERSDVVNDKLKSGGRMEEYVG